MYKQVKSLNDVHFGDLWICSGQSNMEWFMKDIFNASHYIETMKNYPNIKLFKLSHMTSSEPQEDLLELDPHYQTWTSADKNNVELFSAVCLLTARFMADILGQNKVSYIKNIS